MADQKTNTSTPTVQEMQARIAQLEAQLAEKNNRSISFKVAEESGAVSAYGVQNIRPVTLYRQQWERLVEAATGQKMSETSPLGAFLKTNAKYLAEKDDTEQVQKDKKLLRQSESHGVVSHPSAKNKATV